MGGTVTAEELKGVREGRLILNWGYRGIEGTLVEGYFLEGDKV